MDKLMLTPDVRVATRGKAASAVAAAAYISRSRLTNEREGQTYDYTRTHNHERVVCDFGISGPEIMPERLLDRETMWNEVEAVENRANSQIYRRTVVPLPDCLTDEQAVELSRVIIGDRVRDGHVVDAVLHCSTAFPSADAGDEELLRAESLRRAEERLGHQVHRNIHLHINEPLRKVNEDGFEKSKSVGWYLVRDAQGREEQLTAQMLKRELAEGREWEKVYRYPGGLKLTKPEAEERGLNPTKDRTCRQPVGGTWYVNGDWNDRDRVAVWRDQWQERMNEALERAGLQVRVDMRSYERQGVDIVPHVHEGPQVRALERAAEERAIEQGVEYEPVTDARRHNVAVDETNAVIRRLRAMREKLGQAIGRAREVVENAREHVRDFADEMRERMLSIRSAVARDAGNPRAMPVGPAVREQADVRQLKRVTEMSCEQGRARRDMPAHSVYEEQREIAARLRARDDDDDSEKRERCA